MNVAILYGGPSYMHRVSRAAASDAFGALGRRHRVRGVEVGMDGRWYESGRYTDPERVARCADLALNTILGPYGESGHLQQILERHGIPYLGSGMLASAYAADKHYARRLAEAEGASVPRGIVLDGRAERPRDLARRVFIALGPPVVIKPVQGSGGHAVSIIHDYRGLESALERALNVGPRVLAEEYVRGRDATCNVAEDFRGERWYTFPLVPASFSLDKRREVANLARRLHSGLGARHYSSHDFIVAEEPWRAGRVYYLETNTQPDFSSSGHFASSAEAIGLEYPDLLEHLVGLA